MERLRALGSAQRFAIVLVGTVVGNIGRIAFDGLLATLLIALGSVAVLIALGLVELTVWGLRSLKQQRRDRLADAKAAPKSAEAVRSMHVKNAEGFGNASHQWHDHTP